VTTLQSLHIFILGARTRYGLALPQTRTPPRRTYWPHCLFSVRYHRRSSKSRESIYTYGCNSLSIDLSPLNYQLRTSTTSGPPFSLLARRSYVFFFVLFSVPTYPLVWWSVLPRVSALMANQFSSTRYTTPLPTGRHPPLFITDGLLALSTAAFTSTSPGR